MRIKLKPLHSKLVNPRALTGISWHQQATWDAIANPSIDAVINSAITGDGKSYAAYGAFDSGGLLGLYPTNELVRDQERQLCAYQKDWSVSRLTGQDLEIWSQSTTESKRETLLRLSQSEVLLTNPDIFYYLHQGNYVRDRTSELWEMIDHQFQAIIFDEFHVYQPSQVAGILNTILLMRAKGLRHKLIFLSATPNQYLLKALESAQLSTKIIDPLHQNAYQSVAGTGWRQINQSVRLTILAEDRAESWAIANKESILQFWLDHPGSRGAIIVNSIASAKRIKKALTPLFKEQNLKVSENTGFTGHKEVETAIKAELVVGTSTMDVGVDFKINWLLFEGHDAPSFMQRLGRLGRHPGFECYEALAFVPRYIAERLERDCASEMDRIDFAEIINREHRQPNQLHPYFWRWAPVQAFGIAKTITGTEFVSKYIKSVEQLWGRSLRPISSEIKAWLGEAQSYSLNRNLIATEALSFRGTSSLQCAVVTQNEQYLTYNLPSILSNYSYSLISRSNFSSRLIKYTHFYLHVHDLLPQRRKWRFFLPEEKAQLIKGRVRIVNGLTITNDGAEGILSQRLKRTAIVAFIAPIPAFELKRRLELPIHFPLYELQTQVIEDYPVYSIAIDQAALMLDSILGSQDKLTAISKNSSRDLGWPSEKFSDLVKIFDIPRTWRSEAWAYYRTREDIDVGYLGELAFIRHKYSNYDELLRGRTYSESEYLNLKQVFNETISRKIQFSNNG